MDHSPFYCHIKVVEIAHARLLGKWEHVAHEYYRLPNVHSVLLLQTVFHTPLELHHLLLETLVNVFGAVRWLPGGFTRQAVVICKHPIVRTRSRITCTPKHTIWTPGIVLKSLLQDYKSTKLKTNSAQHRALNNELYPARKQFVGCRFPSQQRWRT